MALSVNTTASKRRKSKSEKRSCEGIENATDAEKLSIAAKDRTIPPVKKEKPIDKVPALGCLSAIKPALISSAAA